MCLVVCISSFNSWYNYCDCDFYRHLKYLHHLRMENSAFILLLRQTYAYSKKTSYKCFAKPKLLLVARLNHLTYPPAVAQYLNIGEVTWNYWRRVGPSRYFCLGERRGFEQPAGRMKVRRPGVTGCASVNNLSAGGMCQPKRVKLKPNLPQCAHTSEVARIGHYGLYT